MIYRSARGDSKSPDFSEIIWKIYSEMCHVECKGRVE